MTKSARIRKKPLKNRPSSFLKVRNQIAYCGLWCGSCSVGNGTLNDLAKHCSKTITDYGLDKWGPKKIDYDALLKGLSALGKMEPCPGCLRGGGRTNCELRACAESKGLAECVDCESQDACGNKRLLQHMRSGAIKVGMVVKDKKGDRSKALKTWNSEADSV